MLSTGYRLCKWLVGFLAIVAVSSRQPGGVGTCELFWPVDTKKRQDGGLLSVAQNQAHTLTFQGAEQWEPAWSSRTAGPHCAWVGRTGEGQTAVA